LKWPFLIGYTTVATDVYSADVVSIKQGFYCTTLFTKFFVDINEVQFR
jgi:hypothetical protein